MRTSRLRSVIMFGRKSSEARAQPSAPADSASGHEHDPQAPKGRPTPSRKEAEQARKSTIRAPKGGKRTKEGKKAARERDREDRARSRAGMLAGDERYMPARDRGPARKFARDYVDSRFTLAEYFIFVAIGVILLGFINNPAIQWFVSMAFFLFTTLIVLDLIIMLIQLNRNAAKEFPEKSERKGITLYAALRVLQFRRLRLPPPRVTRRGLPVVPKNKK